MHAIELQDPPTDVPSDISVRSGETSGLPWWTPIIRYGFQCLLTLIVISFCIGVCIWDILHNGQPTTAFNMVFPLIASTMTLHFQLKSATRSLKALRRFQPGYGQRQVNNRSIES